MRAVLSVMGNTTNPFVRLVRPLKNECSAFEIDLANPAKLDIRSLDSKHQEEAASVLTLAQEQLPKETWPSVDYKEMLKRRFKWMKKVCCMSNTGFRLNSLLLLPDMFWYLCSRFSFTISPTLVPHTSIDSFDTC